MTTNGIQHAIRENGRSALAALDVIDVEHPAQTGPDPQLNEAMEHLVRLRDVLIERHREGEDCERWLARVNAMLSGLFGAEYPPGGIQWQRIQRSRDELRELLEALDRNDSEALRG